MADLDDFFAKKDKKKSKTKKFLTPEELAKKLEDTSKKAVEVKPQQPPRKELRPNDDLLILKPEEDPQADNEEWKEFQEVEQKDYSGLKIGQLTLNDDEDELGSGQEGGLDENDTDGEGSSNKDRKQGPWKSVVPAEEVTQIPVEVKPSVYVSPAFKAASKTIKARNRNAPDITNEEYFPTLGAARPEEQRKKKNEPSFEEVRHGGRMQRIQELKRNTEAPVIGNRYDSLAEEDS
ncbi:protein CDV3 homolog isoform X1 [Condylostylus longicornis]|uniref:protein CDV3 homolog isoform X1 n=1 Tax=Condylostylus longicornis TaxID=2530218 RepID=UPI00244D9D62|nr:protein CDV3 homolog isoform X1 [Condylostylus longicornis]XP_055374252.1 protein CDV3 homolog isoform X1 [Condylostylus longicornis]XP_055374253.1 protein CDV3 homolog isoform X1 [Condylostylus longicornis]